MVDTDELKAVLASATDGPWRHRDGMIQSQTKTWNVGVAKVGWDFPIILAEISDDWDQHANARLIALAPTLATELLATREREAALVEALREIATGLDADGLKTDFPADTASAALAAIRGEQADFNRKARQKGRLQ